MRTPLILCGLLLAIPAFAFDVPVNDGFVTDTAQVLSESEEGALERTLSQYRDETTNEIAILIVPTLAGGSIADIAVEVGRAWGVGTEKNNGVLLLVSYDDRELFLATGYGMEGALPDLVAKGIIDTDIVPQFRDGNYFQGMADGIDAIKKHVAGEYTADRYAPKGEGFSSELIFFFIFCLQFVAVFLGSSKSWWLGGVIGLVAGIVCTAVWGWWLSIPGLIVAGLLFDFVVSKFKGSGSTHFWRGGGGFGGGTGGGGFGGFGGGSFGGGGARGRW